MACKICWVCAHVIFFFLEKRCLDTQPFLRTLGDLYNPLNFSSFPNILVLAILNTPDVIYGSTLDMLAQRQK